MTKKYYYSFESPSSKVGSTKARVDVGHSLDSLGYVNKAPEFLKQDEFLEKIKEKNNFVYLILRYFVTLILVIYVFFSLLFMKRNSILAFNYPQASRPRDAIVFKLSQHLSNLKKFKSIAVIHDIYPLFEGRPARNDLEKVEKLDQYDAIVSHNQKMTDYLIKEGVTADKIVNLELFDYLIEDDERFRKVDLTQEIIVAGNLAISKTAFIKDLKTSKNLTFNFYGVNFPEEFKELEVPKVNYFGSFSPDELVQNLVGSYGLVWDSETSQGGIGVLGNYQRYNNPHKTSLYLATGFPVIAWDESAIAPFILEHQIGFVVKDLKELSEKFEAISEADYSAMKQNVLEVGKKLRSGYFMAEALKKAEKLIGE